MRGRAKSYFWFLKYGRVLPGVVRHIVSSAWLGFLDREDMGEISVGSYLGTSGFETAEHNLSGLALREEEAVSLHFTGCRSVLVAGAGAGREVIALARRGMDVVGFDACPDLVAAGQANLAAAGVFATILNAPVGAPPSDLGRFDGLMIGRGVYHHIPGRDGRVAFLRDCARYLEENAPVLLGDFLLRTPDQRGPRRTFAIASAINRLRRGYQPIEPGDILSHGFFHLFVPDEIAAEFELAGIRLVRFDRRAQEEGAGIGSAVGRRAGV